MAHSFLNKNVNPIDYSDVQGLAKYGYRDLVEAKYFLLTVRNVDAAAAWLRSAPVSNAVYQKPAPVTAVQVAFTRAGLEAMRVAAAAIEGFSTEFLQGMTESSRCRRLGDIGDNDPRSWLWGGPTKVPHLLVMIFSKQNLAALEDSIQQQPWRSAFEVLAILETSSLGAREPFGFTDGISQPVFDWDREHPAPATTVAYKNLVALGELLLGYPNEYGKYTDRPLLEPSLDPTKQLLSAEDDPTKKDLGRNGTYFVLRQLEQDVRGFWQYLDSAAGGDRSERYRLGAAMVGRNVDGVPLMTAGTNAAVNDFLYDADPSGTRCPLGAHIRRANPRNADLFGHPAGLIAGGLSRLGLPRPQMRADLIASTRFHRVLRRGREYGPSLSPEEALEPAPAGDPPRGLHFACVCANISRQFEFVQHAWIMSTKFNGMTNENDPLLGNRAAMGNCSVAGNFSIPRDGQLARRLTRIPQFVTVRGGAYFFMPSLRALRYIAQAGPETRPA